MHMMIKITLKILFSFLLIFLQIILVLNTTSKFHKATKTSKHKTTLFSILLPLLIQTLLFHLLNHITRDNDIFWGRNVLIMVSWWWWRRHHHWCWWYISHFIMHLVLIDWCLMLWTEQHLSVVCSWGLYWYDNGLLTLHLGVL